MMICMPASTHNTLPPDAVFTIAEFLELLNRMLKPLMVTVEGEITSLKIRNGHVYFTLSDQREQARLDCVLWKFRHQSLDFKLEEGRQVQVIGNPNIYEPFGKLSFIATKISPAGEGALRQAVEKRKKRLQEAGFFEPDRKRPLPVYPRRIGLITSARGAAIEDFKKHLGNFGYEVMHYDVMVEGLRSIASIERAFAWFNQHSQEVEAIVLTRGGGSLESLQAFNSEEVAQAIFASKVPVLSAVGHEDDVTIADLVADVRGSTPTDAGKILSAGWREASTLLQHWSRLMISAWERQILSLAQDLRHQQFRLIQAMNSWLQDRQRSLKNQQQLLAGFITAQLNQLERWVQQWQQWRQIWLRQDRWWRQRWQDQHSTLLRNFSDLFKQQAQQVNNYEQYLRLVDPQQKLKQGYALVRDSRGQLVTSAKKLQALVNQEVQIELDLHLVSARVEAINRKGKDE